jgi:hypothetical protein
MINVYKAFTLILVCITITFCLALTTPKFANAQTNPKPSAPQATARIVQNMYIEISIKNQPFTPYTDSLGQHIGLYYNFKYSNGDEWTYDPFMPDGSSVYSYGGIDRTGIRLYIASNTEHTIIAYPIDKSWILNNSDFQVQAQIGCIQQNGDSMMARVYGATCSFMGESSDWSSIQTMPATETPSPTETPFPTTTPTSTAMPHFTDSTPTATSTPTSPEKSTDLVNSVTLPLNTFLVIVAVVVLLAVVLLVLFLKLTRRANKKPIDWA